MPELLVIAAERAGAVLLLDDLHLASRECLFLVDDVARLARRHRLVVVAQQPGAVPRPGFEVVVLAERGRGPVGSPPAIDLPAEVAEVLRRLAVIGDRFDRLESTAASGHDVRAAERLLGLAVDSGVVGSESGGYRFADPATADHMAAQVAPVRATNGAEGDRDAGR